MLGKRQRPPMNRTTSMKELTLNLTDTTSGGSSITAAGDVVGNNSQSLNLHGPSIGRPTDDGLDQSFMTAASSVNPRTGSLRRHSADCLETIDFLKACSLCKHRFIPGRDIYMYRGDSAFCSLECRQQEMNKDEKKEKRKLMATKKMEVVNTVVTGSEVATTTAETVVAAAV